ncbi:MAG: hypothetical protein VYA69_08180 [Gemmatimonadota bacterium]|nr:hypothetical protein [Gemmatimonadota bacterium]
MASELGGHSIRVNTVAPNGVDAHTWYRSAVLRTGQQDVQRKGAEPDFPHPADHPHIRLTTSFNWRKWPAPSFSWFPRRLPTSPVG